MVYAPVIIPTLCRYEHFVRCIESLRSNTWARYTDVYIGLDYPAKDSHKDGYLRIKEYLNQDFGEFNQIIVVEREKNFGALANILQLLDLCLETNDRYICLEDDIECAPNFLEYMDIMLDKYEEDDSVIAVTGYCAPVNLAFKEGATAVKQQLQAHTWGIARWKNKMKGINRYLSKAGLAKDFVGVFNSGRIYKMTDWAIKDYISAISAGGVLNSVLKFDTDVMTRITLAVRDKFIIMPTISKTRNLGFDGSGLYCPGVDFDPSRSITSTNYDYSRQPIDVSNSFEAIVDEAYDNEANRKIYNQYDVVDKEELEALLQFAEDYCSHSSAWRRTHDVGVKLKSNFTRFGNLMARMKR